MRTTPNATARVVAGFTLVEMGVVIGVIGVLLAMMAASLISARAKARQIQCLNNLRQLGIALGEFTSEQHGYPLMIELDAISRSTRTVTSTNDGVSVQTSWSGWQDELGKYCTPFSYLWEPPQPVRAVPGLWRCPSVSIPNVPVFPEHWVFFDYGYNAYGMGNWASGSLGLSRVALDYTNASAAPYGSSPQPGAPTPLQDGLHRVPESEVSNPSEMIAIGDGFAGRPGVIADAGSTLMRAPAITEFAGSTRRSRRRHRGKASIVYCDGHSASSPIKSLFEDTDEQFLRTWNRDHLPHPERL